MEVRHLDDLVVFDARGNFDAGFHTEMIKSSVNGGIRLPYVGREKAISAYASQTGLEGQCMLLAHSGARLRRQLSLAQLLTFDKNRIFEWVFADNGKLCSVQEWINEQDGKYLALFLYACNPMNLHVKSNHSILFVPTGDYSMAFHEFPAMRGRPTVEVRMFVPGLGYFTDTPRGTNKAQFSRELYGVVRRELKVVRAKSMA